MTHKSNEIENVYSEINSPRNKEIFYKEQRDKLIKREKLIVLFRGS